MNAGRGLAVFTVIDAPVLDVATSTEISTMRVARDWRHSPTQLDALPLTSRDRLLRTISEKEWITTVIEIAKLRKWLVHHSRPAWVRDGRMVTALSGNNGLPDLILLKPPRLIIAELKTETGPITDEQRRWLKAFADVPGIQVYVWRPADLNAVWRVLSA